MKHSFVYQPTYFFLSSFLIASAALFTATYASYHESLHYLLFPLILFGLGSPTISAFIMLAQSRDKNLWSDFWARFSFSRIKIPFIPVVLLLAPCLILLAITISLLFGLSADQFAIARISSDQALEGKNLLAIVLTVILSCSLEEIGWRGYGIDSLTNRFNLWQTSWIFATFWALWHVPAFFIKNGYFQQAVWNLGMVQVAVYFASLFPITFLINWFYEKNNRSILVAILAHATLNLSYGLFQLEPFTKIITMLLLFTAAGIVVFKERKMFFNS